MSSQNDSLDGLKLYLDNLTPSSSNVSDLIYGFNSDKASIQLLKNKDSMGFVFFTRPDLNLSDGNLSNDRRFGRMLAKGDKTDAGDIKGYQNYSLHKVLRHILDPDQAKLFNRSQGVFNDKQAFIPVLSNTLERLSGWPDEAINVASTEEGVRKETVLIVDGVSEMNSKFSLSAEFVNIPGSVITWLFDYWVKYTSNVIGDFEKMTAKPINILGRFKDYETGIFRIILDESNTRLQSIAYTVGIPVNAPRALSANYDRSKAHNDDADTVSITFECQGAEYDDPILMEEFNNIVAEFNPDMADNRTPINGQIDLDATRRKSKLIKLKYNELDLARYHAYPRINLLTMEFEWWIEEHKYKSMVNGVL